MSKYLSYLHNLRGLAILYVVAVHTRAFLPQWTSRPEINRFFDTFLDPTEGNGTILFLFLFIGGFLFQYLNRDGFDFRKYIQQKFKVIIAPYIIISIPLIILRMNTEFHSLSLPDNFSDKPAAYQVIHFMFTGAHMPPFWFISTIVLFYFTAPLLHKLDNPFFYRYIFPFIFMSCLLTYRPAHNANPFLAYLHYIPIYITGMWASYNRERILEAGPTLLYILVACYSCLCVLDLAGWENVSRGMTFEQVIEQGLVVINIYIFKAVILCFMLMLFLYHFQRVQIPFIELLGNYSFGIFFVHYLYISVTRKVVEGLHWDIPFSIPAYLIYFMFILALSTATVYLVKKLSGRYSRYLIGS